MSRFARLSLLLVTLLVGAGASGLAFWQLRRHVERRSRNQAALAQRELAPIDLNRQSPPADLRYRGVRVSGEYDPRFELFLRNRLVLGTPGVHVITPLRLPGRDTAILINRGFVPSPDAGPPPPGVRFEEPISAAIQGIALPLPDDGDGAPLTTRGGDSWQRLDLSAVRARLPYPVAPFYVIASADSSESADHTSRGSVLPVRVEPPALDDGPHLSYAIQWLMIAGAAVGFGLVFVLRTRGGRETAPPWIDSPTGS